MAQTLTPVKACGQAITYFTRERSSWTGDQTQALDKYNTSAELLYVKMINGGDKKKFLLNHGLEPLIKLFGRIFFCGKLQDVEFRPSETLYKSDGAIASTGWSETGRLFIEVDVIFGREAGDAEDAQTVIGTLLHECVHAYLREVVDDGYDGMQPGDKGYCSPSNEEFIGPCGHGKAWQLLAFEVERKANEFFGSPVPLQLGREAAIDRHLTKDGEWDESYGNICFGKEK